MSKPKRIFTRIDSIKAALKGLLYVITSQKNMWIHLCIAILAVALGLYVTLSKLEWAILILTIGQVVILETVNTSIETSIDLVTKKTKFRAMLSKDVAAGAVLLSALQALVVGYFLFFDKLILKWHGG